MDHDFIGPMDIEPLVTKTYVTEDGDLTATYHVEYKAEDTEKYEKLIKFLNYFLEEESKNEKI